MVRIALVAALFAWGGLGCGGPPGDGAATPRSRASERRSKAAPTAEYDDENSVGMADKRVNRWRWKGARKDCFYVVGNRCFTSEEAACKAAGCSAQECETDESAPVQVSCPKKLRGKR